LFIFLFYILPLPQLPSLPPLLLLASEWQLSQLPCKQYSADPQWFTHCSLIRNLLTEDTSTILVSLTLNTCLFSLHGCIAFTQNLQKHKGSSF